VGILYIHLLWSGNPPALQATPNFIDLSVGLGGAGYFWV